MPVVREERISCSCGDRLVVEYEPCEGEPAFAEFTCPRCSRAGRHLLQFRAAVYVVRRVSDTPVLPRLPER